MKHLKYFENSESKDLIDQLDSDFVNNYFRETYDVDIQEISNYVDIWYFVDDDKFVEDWIDDRVSNSDTLHDEINDEDFYKRFINSHLLENEDVQRYLEKKSKKLGLDEDESYENILEELIISQLERIIEMTDNKEKCIKEYWEGIYHGSSAREILGEFYDQEDLEKNGYKYVENYIDENDLLEYFYDNEDYSYKKDYVLNNMENDMNLQNKLLNLDPRNSLQLFDLINQDIDSIGDEYDFQKAFMNTVIEDNTDEDDDEVDELEVSKEMKRLNDKFGVDPEIMEEYKKYTFYIDVEKFNL
jgi:hypothetical protein